MELTRLGAIFGRLQYKGYFALLKHCPNQEHETILPQNITVQKLVRWGLLNFFFSKFMSLSHEMWFNQFHLNGGFWIFSERTGWLDWWITENITFPRWNIDIVLCQYLKPLISLYFVFKAPHSCIIYFFFLNSLINRLSEGLWKDSQVPKKKFHSFSVESLFLTILRGLWFFSCFFFCLLSHLTVTHEALKHKTPHLTQWMNKCCVYT